MFADVIDVIYKRAHPPVGRRLRYWETAVATVRYLSSDTSIAVVSGKGRIRGVGKGSCYVYAYVHNGVHKKVKVMIS